VSGKRYRPLRLPCCRGSKHAWSSHSPLPIGLGRTELKNRRVNGTDKQAGSEPKNLVGQPQNERLVARFWKFLILPVPGLLLPCNDKSAQSKFSPHPRERHNVGIIPGKKKPRAYWDRNRTAVCDDRRTVGSILGSSNVSWVAPRTRSSLSDTLTRRRVQRVCCCPMFPSVLSGGSNSSAPLAALGTIRPSRKRAESQQSIFSATQASARFCTYGIGWHDSLSARCGGSSPCGSSPLLTLIIQTAPAVCATGGRNGELGQYRAAAALR
jgi:hypothetical protein